MSKKVLLATEKPFAKAAVEGISKIFAQAGYELVKLEKYTDKADLLKAAADVDAMIIRSDKADAAVIEAGKNLKVIVRAGAGYDNIDLAAASAKGICAMNTPGQNSNAVAELALGMMVFLARNKFTEGNGSELRGKKLGIHAYGNVGRLVAGIAKGFGMEICAFDPFVEKAKMEAEGVKVFDKMEDLYSQCDYVSLHIPANDQTKKSINYDLLAKMKKGAALINTARKEVIDEEGLKKAMAEREDLKYATDIAPDCHAEIAEKLGNRYHATKKKMGAETSEANINAGLAAANQIVKFLEQGDRTFQVNK
ncbi:MAG: 3-phosphoglycerate dehydrogenase [Candidatus Edwardsbacteria bacterium RifOxyA12_full_54_48]|uniref:3-phosphoglycerate dehydrogenase n=1 Tax=Candidatus Edwardsbacteria bacterium GWF2_54_11 TaxID=1817851 RepID=A0A1F5RG49_9BACT|nr:MAG: 3-phosphoglycerate dehydrogenase [Candidatus Edwardsbacteria bacterium RifOxyC12_full_54_24]OGF08488.1 MAG: 3-phosphoglycerate dehydrogenase [Candidatus Edwardsbacteria bacterium RifOxyA12_full_54_48]OGF11447.1 MAG: 3-phosphoglycerate dehydrogenase [Candidatus Edwardsbacteria bacterium GWE2_54_12]OGF13382.1 MAG: 3-phosphoglycerate dehydrogenase [Candidatus Edwardsbacteria bacterium GWF2_54_11]OGJ17947.1 MAG: 3-phosphoglycerate dehydrogenase [Candidatus Edwardsbacteria bacterium RifOxyB1